MKSLSRNARIRYLLVLLIIILVVAFVLLRSFSQTSGRIFSNLVLVTCIYQVHVTAFADDNGDGIQNAGESGIAGVMVSLEHSDPPDTTPEAKTTDEKGTALLQADKYCVGNDMLSVNVVPPSGYSATTPLSFGPYPVPEFTFDSMTQAAEQPIPDMIYVGLHRN